MPADFVDGFATAMKHVLGDDELRDRMGRRASEITIPYFTWDRMTAALLKDLGISPNGDGRSNGEVRS